MSIIIVISTLGVTLNLCITWGDMDILTNVSSQFMNTEYPSIYLCLFQCLFKVFNIEVFNFFKFTYVSFVAPVNTIIFQITL